MGVRVSGASLDSPMEKSPTMPLKPAKVSVSGAAAPADSLDGKKVTKPQMSNESGVAGARGEAGEAIDPPAGDEAPGETAVEGETAAAAEGDGEEGAAAVAAPEAGNEDAGDAAVEGEEGGEGGEEAAEKAGDAAEDGSGEAGAEGKEQKILSPGGREETWEATEEEPADA